MAISIARAERHITEWSEELARYPSRNGWVSCLFHACQIETAAEIVRQRRVVCRQNVPVVLCDVANQGALWNNPSAHEFVRLYFRPKNSFHFKTEGIKSSIDPYRINPHMAIPVMLVFDLTSVLTLNESYFVSGNFASQALAPLQGDNNFNLLNFQYIYHDSGVSPEMKQTIHDARMAEVVVRNELSLAHLKAVVCRTIHEERMLRHLLRASDVSDIRFAVEKGGALFLRRGSYITELYTRDGQVHFDFTAPSTARKDKYSVAVACGNSRFAFSLEPKAWRVPQIVNRDPAAEWKIEIEGCTAYVGPVSATGPIVR
ncbi:MULTISPECIES: DarT ssDNA thymidine ADP-ribosyltransferase family protein [unclassified Mesorhizobium]|uniref:DarT ssDNA thymidine ADP-ribosyltransferase family protein n=1 Tax=unclassified Mesorhizobium TaxID=325217 RepID=UPI0033378A10